MVFPQIKEWKDLLICSIMWPFFGGPEVASGSALERRSCPGCGPRSSCDVPAMLGTKLIAGHCMGSSFLVLYLVGLDGGTSSQCGALWWTVAYPFTSANRGLVLIKKWKKIKF